MSKTRPFEYLRLTSLGVIGALVKVRRTRKGVSRRLPAAAARPASNRVLCVVDTDLGAVAACVQVDDTDVINFLLSTEIIPLCLRTMEIGTELSKTVAT